MKFTEFELLALKCNYVQDNADGEIEYAKSSEIPLPKDFYAIGTKCTNRWGKIWETLEKIRLFLDSDAILDYLARREYAREEIKQKIDKGIKKELKLYTSSLVIANVHYFISTAQNNNQAKLKIEKLSSFIRILNVGQMKFWTH